MEIKASQIADIVTHVFGLKADIDHDVPIIESGIRLDSLRMIRLLVEIEGLLQQSLDQEDAFELFGLSINELADRMNNVISA